MSDCQNVCGADVSGSHAAEVLSISNILDVGSGKEDLLKSSVSHVTVSNAPSTTTISTDFDSDVRKTPSSISNGTYWYDRCLALILMPSSRHVILLPGIRLLLFNKISA